MPAPLIVLDGVDGVGKTTQMELLAARLVAEGRQLHRVKFPRYGHPSAAPVTSYLRGDFGPAGTFTAEQVSAMFAVDRMVAAKELRPLLDGGTVVLCDRYVSSNMGHQGSKMHDDAQLRAFLAWEDHHEHTLLAIPRPSLTVILYVPPEVSLWRIASRGLPLDVHEADATHIQASAATYLRIAEMYESAVLIDCAPGGTELSIEEVHDLVWKHAAAVLP
jgi:dTMP kinase